MTSSLGHVAVARLSVTCHTSLGEIGECGGRPDIGQCGTRGDVSLQRAVCTLRGLDEGKRILTASGIVTRFYAALAPITYAEMA